MSYRVGEIKPWKLWGDSKLGGEDSYLVHPISRVSTHTIGYSVPPIPEGIHQRNSEQFRQYILYLFMFMFIVYFDFLFYIFLYFYNIYICIHLVYNYLLSKGFSLLTMWRR